MVRLQMIVMVLVAALAAVGCALVQDVPKEGPPKEPPQKTEQVSPELQATIEGLIKDLGDDDFDKREAAQAELIKICKPALAPVEKALNESDDPEVRNRAAAIAQEIGKTIFTLIGKNAQGYEEYRHEMTGMVFVKVPGGTFKMGSDCMDDEKPVHEVKLDGFLVAKYEVTQAVWQKVIGKNPSQFEGDDLPVEQVTWNDCREFCGKTGLRLPTEAEWEYACRAGTDTNFYWGNERDGDYMWHDQNAGGTTHPVGQKKPNAFGLYDMSGNVWEWCADWYVDDYYKNSPENDPKGPDEGEKRVVRGGCWGNVDHSDACTWGNVEGICRSAIRYFVEPWARDYYIGFRCVQDSE